GNLRDVGKLAAVTVAVAAERLVKLFQVVLTGKAIVAETDMVNNGRQQNAQTQQKSGRDHDIRSAPPGSAGDRRRPQDDRRRGSPNRLRTVLGDMGQRSRP